MPWDDSLPALQGFMPFFYLAAGIPLLFFLGLTNVSGIRDTALDPVHPLLGTLSILGTEIIHTLAGLEIKEGLVTRVLWGSHAGASRDDHFYFCQVNVAFTTRVFT